MDSDYIQEHIFNLDDSMHYGLQLHDLSGWKAMSDYVRIGEQSFYIPVFTTYDTAALHYSNIEGQPVRLVKYSRYLVDSKPIPVEVLKCKTQ